MKFPKERPYHQAMSRWLGSLRRNWDAAIALALGWAAVAIYLGPGYYFILLYVLLMLLIIRVALRR